jgi:WD40 repeat protein
MDEEPPAEPADDAVRLRRSAVASGELLDETAIDGLRGDRPGLGIRFFGSSSDGSTLYLVNRPQKADARLVALRLDTLEILRTRGGVTDGQAKSFAIGPDRALIAVGTSDGYVRVWDSATFELVEELFVADTQVQGLAFLTEDHLAVAPEPGNILVYTLDVDELISVARESLSRGFTPDECDQYNFGEDCPTLEELRTGS